MPRVITVKKARKDQGQCRCGTQIKAGDGYRYWKFRYGGKHIRCMKPECAPRDSDLTQSKLAEVYAAREEAQDAVAAWDHDGDVEDLREALRSAAERAREVGEEYEQAAEPFGNQGENQERYEACEEYADTLESAADDLEDFDEDSVEFEDGDDEDTRQQKIAEAREEWAQDCTSKAEDALGEFSL